MRRLRFSTPGRRARLHDLWGKFRSAVLCLSLLHGSAQAGEALPCQTQTPGGDLLEFTCPLSSAESRRYRFQANFSGGHDDTRASMKLSLDSAPLSCAEDSKTSLFAEEGDVSLHCNFYTSAAEGGAAALKVRLLWSHAEYVGFQLVAE